MFLFQSGPPVMLGELTRQHEAVALAQGYIQRGVIRKRKSAGKQRNQDLNGIFDDSSTSCFVPGLYQHTEDSQFPY